MTAAGAKGRPEVQALHRLSLAEMRALLAAVDEERARLRAETLRAPADKDLPRLVRELADLTKLRVELAERVVALRLQGLARVQEGLERLGLCNDMQQLLDVGAQELARTCDLDRAVVSRLSDQGWRAEAIWLHPHLDAGVEQGTVDHLTRGWIELRRGALEADLVRRGAAAVVSADDPRVDKQLMAVSRSTEYVAAPVMPGGRAIGFLQGDRIVSGRPLSSDDRDLVWAFAQGFGLVVERVALSARLDEQVARARAAFAEAEEQLEELTHEQVRLARDGRPPDVVAARAAQMFLAAPRPSALPALTPRELEVAELLLEGARNEDIARRLSISRETVKNHLSSLMRKCEATTRAEVVAIYLHSRSR